MKSKFTNNITNVKIPNCIERMPVVKINELAFANHINLKNLEMPDTIKEVITITNVDVRALDEIETNITEIMIKNKKEYNSNMKKKESTK